MSPRRGGEAAKFGDRFEGRWTTSNLIDLLMGGIDRITVEAVDPEGDAVEFFVYAGDREEGHQVKRQWQDRTNWSLNLLQDQGILDAAAAMVRGGRDFQFVSTLPAQPLSGLAEAARRTSDFSSFSGLIGGNKKLRDGFDVLADRWGTAQEAWDILRHISLSKPDESQLHKTNVALAQWLFSGEPEPAVAVLAETAKDNLGVRLTADLLWRELEARGIQRNPLRDESSVAEMVADRTDRFLRQARGTLLQPPIARDETEKAIELLRSGRRVVVIAGEAGSGKSAVVAEAVASSVEAGDAVLGFRLDRFMGANSSLQLGRLLDLPASPAVALGAAAAGRRALIVVDQLDAVSLASGRSPELFTVVEELLSEAARFPNMQVVLACRRYDIENDNRLRALLDPDQPGAAIVEVEPLGPEEVKQAVERMGLDPGRLDNRQIELLRLPLNLVLLREVAADEGAMTFSTTQDLLELFWRSKRRAVLARRGDARFDRIVELVVKAMNASQRLSVPQAVLGAENLDDDFDVVASEHVLVRDGRQISFFHEALFDFAFARQWYASGESVLDLLLSGEQELFRRAQIRQVLLYLRDADPSRFVTELSTVLFDERVRFHVKESIVALLRALPNPTDAELNLVLELMHQSPAWRFRGELLIRTVQWFDRIDANGLLEKWLGSGDADLEQRAVTIIGSVSNEKPRRAAELLSSHSAHPDYIKWLMWIIRFTDLEKDRALFDLVLEATRTGLLDAEEHDLFTSAHALGTKAPDWGVELLAAWFVERPAGLAMSGYHVAALKSSDHGLLDLIRESAEGAPEEFVARLLPYMQKVMAAAEQGDHLPRPDWHFSSQIWGAYLTEADEMLMHAMTRALRALAVADPAQLRELLEPLVDDSHSAAQDLLYEGLAAAGNTHADWAAELILRGGHALESGYSDGHYWRTRELLRETGPYMIDENVREVEKLLSDFAPDWELGHPRSRGLASFELLSGLPQERLSKAGRRRLDELRRKFGRDEPEAPRGIVGGFVGSPIPEAQAEHMTDEQWLGAMRKHASDEGDWTTMDLRGGAYQLSQVLRSATVQEPERFARLALQLDTGFNRHYLQGILLGLGDTTEDVDPDLVYEVIRHAAAAGDQDRWLGWPLRRLYQANVPADVVEVVLARALGRKSLAQSEASAGASEQAADIGDGFTSGLNTERGGNAHTLGALVAFDSTGDHAAIVLDHLDGLASDSSGEVRACVAEVVYEMLRWDRQAAVDAFVTLARDRDPQLVRTGQFETLAAAVVLTDAEVAMPVIDDLLASDDPDVRERGARLATFAATDGEQPHRLESVVTSSDPAVRRGAAHVLAGRVRWIDEPTVRSALIRLFDDPDETVREAAASFVSNLRGETLVPYSELLLAFIESPACSDPTQLMITLESAPVPDDELTLKIAERVMNDYEAELGDITTAAAGDARYLARLVLRSYSLAQDAEVRSQLLDVVDRLLEIGAYGIADAIDEARR